MLLYRHIYSGIVAGAIAAMVAIGASLPLESPDDIVLNSASVGFAVLLMGGVNGILWHWSRTERWLNRRYSLTSVALVAASLAVAIGAQTQFDNAVEYTVPLALIGSIGTVVLTPYIATRPRSGTWLQGFLVVIAVATSIGLAGQGDQESGSLSLPPPL